MPKTPPAHFQLVLLLAVLTSGCLTPRGGTADLDAYASGEEHYLAGNFREARAFFTRYIESRPDAQARARARYWLGRCALVLKDYEDAASLFADAARETGEGWVLGGALSGEGTAYIFLGRYAEAGRAFRAAIENAPDDVRIDALLLKLATANLRGGKWSEAEAALDRLVAECAGSPLFDRANELRQYVADRLFVIQVGAYSTRKAAEKERDKLAAKRLSTNLRSIMRAGKPLYVVLVGSYETYAEASRAAERLIRNRRVRDAVVKP